MNIENPGITMVILILLILIGYSLGFIVKSKFDLSVKMAKYITAAIVSSLLALVFLVLLKIYWVHAFVVFILSFILVLVSFGRYFKSRN